MKKITARFRSKCAETNRLIAKGQNMIYCYSTKQCFHLESETAKKFLLEDEIVGDAAHEDEYFDNFCRNNNI